MLGDTPVRSVENPCETQRAADGSGCHRVVDAWRCQSGLDIIRELVQQARAFAVKRGYECETFGGTELAILGRPDTDEVAQLRDLFLWQIGRENGVVGGGDQHGCFDELAGLGVELATDQHNWVVKTAETKSDVLSLILMVMFFTSYATSS